MKRGARWKVGYGDNISVWNDAWLPSLDHPTVQLLAMEGFQEARVVDLINPVSHKWKPELIKCLFTPQEAELILSIPLSQNLIEDKLIWPFVSLGSYSVKSGYNNLVIKNSILDTNSNNPSLH